MGLSLAVPKGTFGIGVDIKTLNLIELPYSN
jgi:hypothetical protein